MVPRRIIAVSPDKALGKQLATALKAAGGAVDLHPSLDELGTGEVQAALVVLHLDGELATAAAEILPRLVGDARIIAVLPKSNVPALVDVMQSSERLAGLLVAEDLDTRELSAMATRVLAGDIFGLDKLVTWGTLVHTVLVGDYQEKSLAIAQISEFAEAMSVRRKYREAIDQCVDEMLMNALYDAPVDEHGKPIFSEIPTKTRISLRVEQKAVVQFACDGHRFAVGVRDAFGTLERSTVLRYLHKCLHAEQQIDRKVGGAGLGLYLMVSAASTVYFNVLPGVATEAICVFDLESTKLQIRQFGFFTEKIDATGRLAAGSSRRLPTSHPVERRHAPEPRRTPRGLIAFLSAATVCVLVLIGVAAWQRRSPSATTAPVTFTTVPSGATIEIEGRAAGTTESGNYVARDLEVGRAYPVVVRLDGYRPRTTVVQPQSGGTQLTLELEALAATVVLESQPPGATVRVDDMALGTTPLALTSLAPGTTVAVTFAKAGFAPITTTLEVPGPGKEVRLVQPLPVSDELARIRIDSDPPGAQVVQNDQVLAGVTTPAEILVEAGKAHHFTLTLPKHVPARIAPFTPARGATGMTKTARLVPGATVRVEAPTDGKVTITPASHCRELPTPAECVLAPSIYKVDFTTAGGKARRTIRVGPEDQIVRFELGFVEPAVGKQLAFGGQRLRRLVLEAGARTVTVVDDGGPRQVQVRVKPGQTVVAD